MASILAVDDSKTMRDMVTRVLVSAGHQVTTAEDGVKALELARNGHYDLVVSDVNMPNLNGTALLFRLRRLPNYETTPVIMLTTEGDGYKKEKAKSAGASGWLQKPFDPNTLISAIGGLLT